MCNCIASSSVLNWELIRWLPTAVVQRPELGTNRSVDSDSDSVSDPYSDPVTRYRTCGVSGKKLNLSKTQICIGEYP